MVRSCAWRSASATLAAASMVLLSACAVPAPTGVSAPLAPADTPALGFTPLLVTFAGEGGRWGAGSGTLVHDRVLLTAGHVVPPGTVASVMAFGPGAEPGEVVRVERVVRGGGGPGLPGDWALAVLGSPMTSIGARPARRLRTGPDAPPPGTPLVIAGYPFASPDAGALDREGRLLRTTAVPTPPALAGQGQWCAAAEPGRRDWRGMSGAGVLVVERDGPPVIAGVYLGRAGLGVLGLTLGRTLLIEPLPAPAIERTVQELSAPGPAPP